MLEAPRELLARAALPPLSLEAPPRALPPLLDPLLARLAKHFDCLHDPRRQLLGLHPAYFRCRDRWLPSAACRHPSCQLAAPHHPDFDFDGHLPGGWPPSAPRAVPPYLLAVALFE